MAKQDRDEVRSESAFRHLLSEVRVAAVAASALVPDLAAEFGNLLVQTEGVGFAARRLSPGGHAVAQAQMPGIVAGKFPEPWDAVRHYLAPVWDDLPWHYGYDEHPGAPISLQDSIAFAELAGPAGPFETTDLKLGFTLIAPGTEYPWHAHPARELYIVLSGRACWSQPSETAWRDPGAIIYHAPGVPHAMRTDKQPLLALYAWRGAIGAPSRYVRAPTPH